MEYYTIMLTIFFSSIVLALAVVPVISVAARKFGYHLRELSNTTQAAAAEASSMAQVVGNILILIFILFYSSNSESWKSYTFYNPNILHNVYHNEPLASFFTEKFWINVMYLKFKPASLNPVKRLQQNLN